MGLKEYKKMRDSGRTTKPGGCGEDRGKHSFVVQQHDANRLHYDFGLVVEGVLKSWAVPEGPSMNPHHKRLAVMVGEHSSGYSAVESLTRGARYGPGTASVWDQGTYTPADRHRDVAGALREGLLEFELHGEKLKGLFTLVHTDMAGRENNWLLIKKIEEPGRVGLI